MIRIDLSEIEQKLNLLLEKIEVVSEEVTRLKSSQDTVTAKSITEIAKQLSCSKSKVRKLYLMGKLEGYQQAKGGKIYIYPESIENYLRNQLMSA